MVLFLDGRSTINLVLSSINWIVETVMDFTYWKERAEITNAIVILSFTFVPAGHGDIWWIGMISSTIYWSIMDSSWFILNTREYWWSILYADRLCGIMLLTVLIEPLRDCAECDSTFLFGWGSFLGWSASEIWHWLCCSLQHRQNGILPITIC